MTDNPRAFPSGAIDDKFGGMTLLDWYAGQALPGIIRICVADPRNRNEPVEVMFARKSYAIARAMLAERERQP